MTTSKTINAVSIVPRLAVVPLLGIGLVAGNAVAATATDNLAVTASVANNCLIDASAGLAFGSYDPIDAHSSSPLDSTGSVSVTCTDGGGWAITLGQGANADTGSTDAAPLRRLTDTTDFLSYSLFSDSGRTVVWGNDGTVDVTGTGNGSAQATTIYGRITAGQNSANAGSYTDTVVATVTF